MKAIRYWFAIIFLISALNSVAQRAPVPKSYSLTKPEDYANHEADVIKVINWLEQAPWDAKSGERQSADAFLLAWLSGSPTVTIDLSSDLLIKIMERNKELMISYMAGYAKYALQNRAEGKYNTEKAKLEGFKAVITKYNTEKSRSRDKNVEMLAKLESEGQLESWVTTELSVNKTTGQR